MNMSKSALELLFDSRARVKILKFLFRNTGMSFGVRDLSGRIQERPTTVRKEVRRLMEMGLLKKKIK